MRFPRLAFVDVETTGLSAGNHRIAEIGVVTADESGVTEWGTLLDPGRRVESSHEFGAEPGYFVADRVSELPRFGDIAADLAARLDGRLLIAHNARFDYAFLKSEFERVGISFAPAVLCSVMLSRKLFPQHDRHDLDAAIGRYGLRVEERHRALPDARALHRFWQAIHHDIAADRIAAAIEVLLAEPLLPAHIDLGMIDALPERPGVFMFDGDDDKTLHIGRAANLRRDVKRYFRLDRECARAVALSHRLTRIRWKVASGPLDARLREIALRSETSADSSAPKRRSAFSICIDPAAMPVATIVDLRGSPQAAGELFGIYATERKAANALRRLAATQRVCHRLLGLTVKRPCECGECFVAEDNSAGSRQRRARHLLRLMTGISPLRVQPWPFAGAIAVREGRSVHVFDGWEYLGTVRTGADMHALLQVRRNGFDTEIYKLLARALPRLSPRALRNVPAATSPGLADSG